MPLYCFCSSYRHRQIYGLDTITMRTQHTLKLARSIGFKAFKPDQLTFLVLFCFCSLGLVITTAFGNRSFFLGFLTAILFIGYVFFQRKMKIGYLVGLLIIFTLSLALFFKLGSSQGRLLIYKVSFDIFKDHWLMGLGFAEFKRSYLAYQANYFAKGNYTAQELLLADNTYFVFNDYWQFVLEWGLGAVVIIVGLAYLCFLAIGKTWYVIRSRPFLMCSVCSLLILATAALFTHVFEKWYWQLVFWSSFVTLTSTLLPKLGLQFKLTAYLLVFSSVLLFHIDQLKSWRYAADLRDAEELVLMGYQEEGLEAFVRLSQLRADDRFLFAYAQACASSGNLTKAVKLYQSIAARSNSICLRIAELYRELNDPRAESWYKLAVDMVPNRFNTRKALFNYYIAQKDYTKAQIIGLVTLRLPIKIPSAVVDRIRSEVSTSLDQISKFNHL